MKVSASSLHYQRITLLPSKTTVNNCLQKVWPMHPKLAHHLQYQMQWWCMITITPCSLGCSKMRRSKKILGSALHVVWSFPVKNVARGMFLKFLALRGWNGSDKSAHFEVTPSAGMTKRSLKTSRNTPQNGGVDIWFMRFHFRASIMPIRPSRFTLLKGQKLKKMPYATILTEKFQFLLQWLSYV